MFNDAIKCQIDIALPILEELKLRVSFVYTSMFEGKPDNLSFLGILEWIILIMLMSL